MCEDTQVEKQVAVITESTHY